MAIQQPNQWLKPWIPYDQAAAIGVGDTNVITFTATTTYCDCRQGAGFSLTLTASLTNFQLLQMWPGQRVRIYFKQDTSGSRAVTNWLDQNGVAALWAGGSALSLTATASAVDVADFVWEATSAKLYGFTVGKAFA